MCGGDELSRRFARRDMFVSIKLRIGIIVLSTVIKY